MYVTLLMLKIKAMSPTFSGGKQVIKAANARNWVEFVYSSQQKMKNYFPLKKIMVNYEWK